MKIKSLKNNGNLQLEPEKRKFEITYVYDDNSEIQTMSVPVVSDNGKKISEAIHNFNKDGDTDTFIATIEKILEFRTPDGIRNKVKNFKKKQNLSGEIWVSEDGLLYVGDQEVNEVLAKHIIDLFENKDSISKDEWLSIIKFTERLYRNTSEIVRNQLYGWLSAQLSAGRLTLTPQGTFIGYKACNEDINGVPVSSHAGHAIVDGNEIIHDYIPNLKGSFISIPRVEVDPDPEAPCSIGLHVGTYKYAHEFLGPDSILLSVEVAPEDVVSVPADANCQKVRTCAYHVLDTVKQELEDFVYVDESLQEEEDKDAKAKALEYFNFLNAPERAEKMFSIDYASGNNYVGVTEHLTHDFIVLHLNDGNYRTLTLSKIENVDVIDEDEDSEYSNAFLIDYFTNRKFDDVPVSLEYNSGKKYDGSVINVDVRNNTVTLQLDSGDYKTFSFHKIVKVDDVEDEEESKPVEALKAAYRTILDKAINDGKLVKLSYGGGTERSISPIALKDTAEILLAQENGDWKSFKYDLIDKVEPYSDDDFVLSDPTKYISKNVSITINDKNVVVGFIIGETPTHSGYVIITNGSYKTVNFADIKNITEV